MTISAQAWKATFLTWLAFTAPSARANSSFREGPITSAGTEAPCVRPASWLKEYSFVPNCSGVGHAGARSALMKFNSAGLRDRDYSPAPRAGVLRIMLLGASNALGIGLKEDLTLARLLEKNLRGALKREVEVINAATNGYCTWQTAFRISGLLRAYRPHLVLHNTGVPSCFLSDLVWEDRIVRGPEGEPLGFDRGLVRHDSAFAFLNKLYYHPRIFFPLLTMHEMLRRIVLAWRVKFAPSGDAARFLTGGTRRALEFMRAESDRQGARFVSFFHPSTEPLTSLYVPYVMNERLASAMARLLPQLQLNDSELHRQILGERGFCLGDFRFGALPDDGHMNAESTLHWSQLLAQRLRESPELGLPRPHLAGWRPAQVEAEECGFQSTLSCWMENERGGQASVSLPAGSGQNEGSGTATLGDWTLRASFGSCAADTCTLSVSSPSGQDLKATFSKKLDNPRLLEKETGTPAGRMKLVCRFKR